MNYEVTDANTRLHQIVADALTMEGEWAVFSNDTDDLGVVVAAFYRPLAVVTLAARPMPER